MASTNTTAIIDTNERVQLEEQPAGTTQGKPTKITRAKMPATDVPAAIISATKQLVAAPNASATKSLRPESSPATFVAAASHKQPGKQGKHKSATTGPTKAEIVLKKLRSAKGTTIVQLVEATSWQAHSVRGFLSGTVRKKLGLMLLSETGKDGVRRYRIDGSGRPE